MYLKDKKDNRKTACLNDGKRQTCKKKSQV